MTPTAAAGYVDPPSPLKYLKEAPPLDQGLEVHRRIDASPWAILHSGAEETVAEAADRDSSRT